MFFLKFYNNIYLKANKAQSVLHNTGKLYPLKIKSDNSSSTTDIMNIIREKRTFLCGNKKKDR